MSTEMGEYLVGAYLKLVKRCDFVDYNVRTPGGGLAGLNELDVVGIHFKDSTAYLCEVTTHIRGVLYKNNQESVNRITKKYDRQRNYAKEYLKQFKPVFMFWAPYVPKGYITDHLARLEGLQLIINSEYKQRVNELMSRAKAETHDTGNPVFRVFQILGALRD